MKGSEEWEETPQKISFSVSFSANDGRGTGIAVHSTGSVKYINSLVKYMP